MSHIFISYSRKDIDFAQKIVTVLAENDLDTWIDWKSIPKGEDWEQEIYRGIEAAEAFLFLISSDSVASEMCNKEIAHAVKNGKRILPIFIADVDDSGINGVIEKFLHEEQKKEISRRNFIKCRNGRDDFDNVIEETRKTIHTDYDWLKYHTELQVKALKWEQKKDNSRLLRGKELREAEEQLTKAGSQIDPQPTELHRNYLFASQRNEVHQRRQITIGLGVGLIVVSILAIFAWTQRSSAITERDNANRQALLSRAGELAALSQNLGEDYPERSLLLAIEAIKTTSDAGEKRLPQAEQALRDGLIRLNGIGLSDSDAAILTTAFSPDSHWLATGSVDGSIHLYDMYNSDLAHHPIVFRGHRDGVTALAFSPDNQWLASGGGTDISELFRESGSMNSVMFTLALVTRKGEEFKVLQPDTQIRIWNLNDLDAKHDPILLSGHTKEISALAFSPNGRWFASSSFDGTIQLWDLEKGGFDSNPLVLKGHNLNIVTVAFSPDDHWLISASLDQTAILWNLNAADPNTSFVELAGHSKAIQAIALSPDGRWLATAGIDFTVRLWDLKSQNPANQSIVLEGHTKNILGLVFSPDSHWLASGSVDNTIRLWDLSKSEAGNDSQMLQGPENFNFRSLVFTPDNHWLIASGDYPEGTEVSSHVYMWEIFANSQVSKPRIIAAHDGYTKQIALSPDGRWLASSSWNGSSRLWDMGAVLGLSIDSLKASSPIILPPIPGSIKENIISPNGHWLAKIAGTSLDESGRDIYLWQFDQLSGKRQIGNSMEPLKLSGHTGTINSVVFSKNNHWLASAGLDRTVRLWDLTVENIANSSVIYRHTAQPAGVVFSPDNHWLAFSSFGKELYLLDMTTPRLSKVTLVGAIEDINPWAIAFSQGGQWIAAGTLSGPVYIWKIPFTDQSEPYIKLEGHQDEITKVIFPRGSEDRIITSSSDSTVRIWTISASAQSATSLILQGHTGPILTMSLSSDDRWLATGSVDLTGHLWDLSNSGFVDDSLVLPGHTDYVFNVTFSNDNKLLISTGFDGTTRLWDLTASNPAHEVIILPGSTPIVSIAISPDDNWLITSTSSGEIFNTLGSMQNIVTTTKLWSLNLDDLIRLACQISGRNLSYSEWQEYFPSEDYRITCQSNPIHPSILTTAGQLVMRGEVEQAKALLNQAKALDPTWDVDIEAEITRFRIYGLLRDVRSLAQSGDVQGAAVKLDEATKLDPSITGTYSNEINKIAEATIVKQINVYIKQENYLDAVEYLFGFAQSQFDTSNLDYLWNMICWEGGLSNHASDVLIACEQAVALDPNNANYRDSRGLVRALIGDKSGAIEDFGYFVEWVYGPDSLLRKQWVSELQQGENPFTEKTLVAIRENTIALPELPYKALTIDTNGPLKIDVINIPDDLKVEFPAFLQCRENRDSIQLVDHYIGILAVKASRKKAWVENGIALITLETESGDDVAYYASYFQLGPDEVGWLIPEPNIYGTTMSSSGPAVDKIKIEFYSLQWRTVTADSSTYQLELKLEGQTLYGNKQYPQSQFKFKLHNTGTRPLRDLNLFGVLVDQQGNTVDILTMDSSTSLETISPDMSVDFSISSLSQSGRCVGPRTSQKYQLHYWATFKAEDNQQITQYYTTDLP